MFTDIHTDANARRVIRITRSVDEISHEHLARIVHCFTVIFLSAWT